MLLRHELSFLGRVALRHADGLLVVWRLWRGAGVGLEAWVVVEAGDVGGDEAAWLALV